MVETYTTGKPCRRGHTGPRYKSNGKCVACEMEYHAVYRNASRLGGRGVATTVIIPADDEARAELMEFIKGLWDVRKGI